MSPQKGRSAAPQCRGERKERELGKWDRKE